MNSLKLPLLLFIALIVGCFATSCGGEKANKDENTEVSSVNDVPDSLSFIIACLPTYESLPFYYAKAAGIADSLSLPLRIKTYQSQFDADTALLGTRADAGVTDLVRQQHYAAQGKMRGYVAWIPLQGEWQLLVGGRLRLTEMKQLKQRTIAIVNTHKLTIRVNQSAARITWVNSCISLNYSLVPVIFTITIDIHRNLSIYSRYNTFCNSIRKVNI